MQASACVEDIAAPLGKKVHCLQEKKFTDQFTFLIVISKMMAGRC